MELANPILNEFTVIGISHWYADLEVRERFSLSSEAKKALLNEAGSLGLHSLLVLSTCNRTEIFTRSDRVEMLSGLMVKFSNGTRSEFEKYGFVKHGEDAIRHFFRVAIGLDAQILGDLQIIQQVKQAYDQASGFNLIDGVTHRLMQSVFRTHKRSRTETSLGSGAATTAYAAVQAAKNEAGSLEGKKVLLVGTGKIGKVTCMNLLCQKVKNITLINRNPVKAEKMGIRFDVRVAEFSALQTEIARADIVIVATGSPEAIVTTEHVAKSAGDRKILLDLSVPRNIEPQVGEIEGIHLINMDMLNDRTDETYRERQANIPLVEKIIDQELDEFRNWVNQQRVVPTIKALSRKLDEIRLDEMDKFRQKFSADEARVADQLTRRIVNKILAYSIDHLKEDHEKPDEITKLVHGMFKITPEE